MAPAHSVAANSLDFQPKEIKVSTPRRGHTKNIVVNSTDEIRNFPIGRLNNYDKELKKHKGPLSLASELESIEDLEEIEDCSSKNNRRHDPSCMASGNLSGHLVNSSRESNSSCAEGGPYSQRNGSP